MLRRFAQAACLGWLWAGVAAVSLPAQTANLGILTFTDAPDPVITGGNLTYTTVATNIGPNAATAVRLTNALPPAFTFVSASIAVSGSAMVTNPVITFTNTPWRYNQDGVDLGADWRAPGYNDSAWPSGFGAFAYEPGYAATWQVPTNTMLNLTPPGGGTQVMTYYFRTTFVAANHLGNPVLRLRYQLDDGMVVYLNGQEIWRTNMPTGDINYNTQALAAHTENVLQSTNLAVTNLVVGTNYLAVEVHQNGTASSDIYFGMAVDVMGVSGAVSSYTVQDGTNVVFTVDSLPAAGNVTATVVARSGPPGIVSARASIGSSTTDPAPGNNAQVAATTVNAPPAANLALTLTDFPDPLQVSNLLTYTLAITNSGPVWATNTFLTNTLPAGVEWVSAVISNAGLVTQYLTLVTFSNTWAYNQSNLALGFGWTAVSYDDSSWPQGEAALGFEPDPLPVPIRTQLVLSNDTGRIPTYYFRTPFVYQGPPTNFLRLRLLVDDGALVYLNGVEIFRTTNMPAGNIAFTTLATSAAPEGVILEPVVAVSNLLSGTNILAVEVHQNSLTSSDVAFAMELEQANISRGAYTVDDREVVFQLGNLPSLNAALIWLTVRPIEAGMLTNVAEVWSLTYDANHSNNVAATTTLVSSGPVGADLSLTVTDTPDPVIQGQDLTYTITVRNHGPAAAPNTRVTNVFFPAVALVALGPGCAIEGSAIVCDLGRILTNAQASVTLVVRPQQVGTLTNLVVVSSDEVDAAPLNNLALVSTVVETSLRADLRVTLQDAPDPVIAGETFTNTITVFNAGLSNAVNVTLTNRWFGPALVQAVRVPPGVTYTNLGGGVYAFSLGALPAGSNTVVSLEALALSVGTVTNLASVSSAIFDPNPANNSAVGTTRVNPTPVVDLVTTIATVPAVPYGGFPMLYVVRVQNAGTLNATGVVLTNWLPPEITLVGVTNVHGAATNTGNGWAFQLGNLPIGASATVLVQVVTPPSGALTNIAVAFAQQTDFNVADNLALLVTVAVPGTAADVGLTVSPSASNTVAGQEVSLRLTLVNNGPLTATGITLTNRLPAGIQFLRGSVTAGAFLAASNEVAITVPALANGASMQAVIVVRPLTNGWVTNLAWAVATTPDPTPNYVETPIYVAPAADVSISVAAPDTLVPADSIITYTIHAVNAGPTVASNATVYCYLPVSSVFRGAFPSQGTFSTSNSVVLWRLGNLPAGQTATLELDFVPGGSAQAVSVIGITAEALDPVPTNNTVTVTTPVLQGLGGGDLVITPTTNANALAAAITGGASGIRVHRVALQAHRREQAMSSGLFTSANIFGSGLPLSGVVLSTGNVRDYGSGPNTDTGRTTAYGRAATEAQEALLDPITRSEEEEYNHYDVTQFDIYFELLPGFERVTFKVMFGSEEYPEFVDSSFIDGFGIYLDGVNIAYANGLPVNIRHPAMMPVPGTELDGIIMLGGTNPVMEFTAPVPPGLTEHRLTFIIADTSDSILDTTVYVASLAGALGAVADLGIQGTVAPDPVRVGQPLTYTLAVTNHGPSDATNTVVTSQLPDAFASLNISVSTGTYTVEENLFTWNLGSLPRRGAAQATLTAVPQFDARLNVAFTVASDQLDLHPTNNTVVLSCSAVELGSFYGPSAIIIRDGAAALPYPSTILVSGLTGVVDKVIVTLLDLQHTFPADIQAMLVAPGGRQVLLMAGAGGGYDASGVSLQFADDAPRALPQDQALNTGSYRPSNLAATNRFPGLGFLVGPSFSTSLSALRRMDPNGEWALFIYDSQGGDSGVLQGGWNLHVNTTPEMTMNLSGAHLVISWHDLPGYVLEGAAALTANPQWVAVTQASVVSGDRRTVTVPMSAGLKFFRLRRP